MAKLFDYPRRGWEANSNYDADQLALAFCKIASDVGIKVHRLSASNPSVIGWDSVVKFPGGHIQFKNERAGCHIVVVNSYEDKEIDYGILLLWKHFVNKGIIFGGPYVREFSVEKNGEIQKENSSSPKLEQRKTLDRFANMWIRRGYGRLKGGTMIEWLEENDAPPWLTRSKLYNYLKTAYEKDGRNYVRKKKN